MKKKKKKILQGNPRMSIRKKKESAVKGMDLQRDTNEKVLKRQKILGGIWCLFFGVAAFAQST